MGRREEGKKGVKDKVKEEGGREGKQIIKKQFLKIYKLIDQITYQLGMGKFMVFQIVSLYSVSYTILSPVITQ